MSSWEHNFNQYAIRYNEDANKYLRDFLALCSTIKLDMHTNEGKILILLLFNLRGDAEHSLPTISTITWPGMEEISWAIFTLSIFLKEKHYIWTFRQREGKWLGEAFKRFKKILATYPTYNFNNIYHMQIFYNDM